MTKEEVIIELRSGRIAVNHGRWTEEDRKSLTKMHLEGVDMSDMALILHRSERAVSSQIDKLGLIERSRASRSKKEGCLCSQCSLRETCTMKRPCK